MTGTPIGKGHFLDLRVRTDDDSPRRDDDGLNLRARLSRIPIQELEARYCDGLDRSLGDGFDEFVSEGALKAKEA
jgi:hypothetical protein